MRRDRRDFLAGSWKHILTLTDSCKTRKQRCDGSHPCKRCTERGDEAHCVFEVGGGTRPRRSRKGGTDAVIPHNESSKCTVGIAQAPPTLATNIEADAAGFPPASLAEPTAETTSPSSIGADHSRYVQDKKGRLVFIGDSANLSLLHILRSLVRDVLEQCPFVDDPLRYSIVEAAPDSSAKGLGLLDARNLPDVSDDAAKQLVEQFFVVADGVVDLFAQSEILATLSLFHGQSNPAMSPQKAVLYIILAIGAQSAADPYGIAEAYFNYSRFSAGYYLTEDVSIQSTQLYLLLALFLHGASRRNAAYVCLGQAIRSAYALGIHQQCRAHLFSEAENKERTRLWSSIRVMELFTSASLGRPSSTASITTNAEAPSLSDDVYDILGVILTDVYGQHKLTAKTLSGICSRQRKWAGRFVSSSSSGMAAKTGSGTSATKLIGFMNLQQTYYWTIMLLTRPFLVDHVAARARKLAASPKQPLDSSTPRSPSRTLIHACVNSAVQTVALLEPLLTATDLPYHLPVLINAAFHAALIIGLAYFGDLYLLFPLESALDKATAILQLFPHDSIAMRYLTIAQYLSQACATYFEQRHSTNMVLENEAISYLFGQIQPRKIGDRNSQLDSAVAAQANLEDGRRNGQRGSNVAAAGEVPLPDLTGSLDRTMAASPRVSFDNDIFWQFGQSSDLGFKYPTPAQHGWVETDSDLLSIFVGTDLGDPDLAFLGQ